ncbi:lytic transglycosylase domain-containing protein [Jongsikchunia kroppenstedtii]|uniref:lytic transglycosylase domain-containing protein n=1 Tax=Jongsikchunia kroppenstedtii TaxID=1121721 RepID=UPI00037AEF66|nr:lytic transglycosylase domain-containing protein [Jongsikchunia kroppenstedtii]
MRTVAVGFAGVLGVALVCGTAAASTGFASAPRPAPIVATPQDPGVIVQAAPAAYLIKPPAEGAAPTSAVQPAALLNLPSGPLGIPGIVLQAYKMAAGRLAAEQPQCGLPWFLLAGIGKIESNHAGNGNVDASGTALTPISGPVLDGHLAGNEVVKNADGSFARAEGPMQFMPGTWAAWGADGNGDGKKDPQNVFDATYAAGRYLCAGVTGIMNGTNPVSAVLRYNNSMAYVGTVLAWSTAYSTGVMPTNPIPQLPTPAATSCPPPGQVPGQTQAATTTVAPPGGRNSAPGTVTNPTAPPGAAGCSTAPSAPSSSASPTPTTTTTTPTPPPLCFMNLCLPAPAAPAPLPAPAPPGPGGAKPAAPKTSAPAPAISRPAVRP